MTKTLRDWLPSEALGGEYSSDAFQKFLDVEVVEEIDMMGDMKKWRSWPGTHKNVLNWVVLANGKAVGWNENPAIGWSFPVTKAK